MSRSAGSALKWIGVLFVAGFAMLILLGLASSVWEAWAGA